MYLITQAPLCPVTSVLNLGHSTSKYDILFRLSVYWLALTKFIVWICHSLIGFSIIEESINNKMLQITNPFAGCKLGEFLPSLAKYMPKANYIYLGIVPSPSPSCSMQECQQVKVKVKINLNPLWTTLQLAARKMTSL